MGRIIKGECWRLVFVALLLLLVCAGYRQEELPLNTHLNTSKKDTFDEENDRPKEEIYRTDFLEGSQKIRFILHSCVSEDGTDDPPFLYELYDIGDFENSIIRKGLFLFQGGSSIRSTLEIFEMAGTHYIYHNFRVKEVIGGQGIWVYDVHLIVVGTNEIKEIQYKFKETEDLPETLSFLYEGKKIYQYPEDFSSVVLP